MMTCQEASRLLVRAADADVLDPALEAHVETCAACRAALEDQRRVAALLRSRPADVPPAHFAAGVRARIERDARDAGGEDAGLLGLANWRAWGGGLLPVAAALTLAAWLGAGTTAGNGGETPGRTAESFATWAHTAGDDQVSLFLQPGTSRELLLESVLTGAVPPEDPDVR